MKKILGIDLGTTNSCVALWEAGRCMVIPDREGRRTMPSVVSYTTTGKKVGETAKRQAALYPRMTVNSVKRLMGEPFQHIETMLEQFPYAVVKGSQGEAMLSLEGEILSPQQVSAQILHAIKSYAEDFIGASVSEAVITVPAHFNERQRQATKDAAMIAGLNVLRLLNEPTAAAIAYLQEGYRMGNVVVFDLGGGTFDISVLNCSSSIYDVIAIDGDTHLGGDDLDKALADLIAEDYRKECGTEITLEASQLLRIREEAEKAKISLSANEDAQVIIPFLAPGTAHQHLNRFLLRSTLEELAAPMLERCQDLCLRALQNAHLEVKDIDHVLLVGGSTKMPCVRRMVSSLFGIEPSHAFEADEIVALGAAIEGARLSGAMNDFQLLEVTPLSLGVMAKGGVYEEIIPENTTIPTSVTKRFLAASPSQPGVTIRVAQQMKGSPARMVPIGLFDLMGLTQCGQQLPTVDVLFDMDRNGLLTVSATDVASGRKASLRIEHVGTLSEEKLRALRERMLDSILEDRVKELTLIHPDEPSCVVRARALKESSSPENRSEAMKSLCSLLERYEKVKSGDPEEDRMALTAEMESILESLVDKR